MEVFAVPPHVKYNRFKQLLLTKHCKTMQLKFYCKSCSPALNLKRTAFGLSAKCMLKMKLTAILIFIAVMQVSAAGNAQSITISKQNASLETIFKEVKEQTGYLFFYNKDWMSKAKKVTINVKNATLDDVLKLCFKDQQLNYAIIGNTIVLTLKQQSLQPALNTTLLELQQTVSGVVRDENGALEG